MAVGTENPEEYHIPWGFCFSKRYKEKPLKRLIHFFNYSHYTSGWNPGLVEDYRLIHPQHLVLPLSNLCLSSPRTLGTGPKDIQTASWKPCKYLIYMAFFISAKQRGKQKGKHLVLYYSLFLDKTMKLPIWLWEQKTLGSIIFFGVFAWYPKA